MNRPSMLRAVAALSTLSLLLAACGGGANVPSTSLPGAGAPAFNDNAVPASLQIKEWGESTLKASTYVGPVSNAHLSVNVLVHQQSAQALLQYAAQVSDPSSPNFRKWLTPQQIADRFGASKAAYQAAANYFEQQGLTVGAWPQRMLLAVSGGQPAMERAFGTKFGIYRRNGQTFVGPTSTPHFSTVVPVDEVGHLVAYSPAHTYIVNPPRAGSGLSLGYSPQQVRAAFDFNNAYKAGYTGAGVTLAIIGTGPIDSYAGGSGDRDLDKLAAMYNNVNVAHVTQVNVTASQVAAGLSLSGIPTAAPSGTPPPSGFPYSNAFQTPPPVTKPCSGTLPLCNPEDGEAQLDVQQAASLAPGAAVHFVLAYNAADCTTTTYPNACAGTTGAPAIGIEEADPEIQQVIADNTADIISMSYGGGESQNFGSFTDYSNSFFSLQFAELTVEGIAAFASSGDSGSAECLGAGNSYLPQVCVSYPSGDNNVTSVGGVTAYVNSLGALSAPMLAWGISTGDTGYGVATGSGSGASGGGTSTFMPAPSWQQSALHATMREQPDVSMIADLNTGVTMYQDASFLDGGPSIVGGTSVASPQMAAMWALVLSACRQHPGSGFCPSSAPYRLGNAAPYLYAILKQSAYHGLTPSLPYADVFYDVLYGSNEMASNNGSPSAPVPGAKAMTGYDQVTGVGVPYAGHLIQAIVNQPVP